MMIEQPISKSTASRVLQLKTNDAFVHDCYAIYLPLIMLVFTPRVLIIIQNIHYIVSLNY